MRRLNIKIGPTCADCPYCRYNGDYGMSYDSGWDCENDEGEITRIVDDWEVNNSNNKNPAGWPEIPEGCPLPKCRK